MKNNLCTASCRHLRGIKYGFDGSTILTPYNGKDRLAVCAQMPGRVIHMRSLPACLFGKRSP
ncbi:hypothetical protein [Geoalkalibacter halelectricus]|uniref:hypothetical protein n=1 Tax=Geoalkalibacter halelectricus TaxID=2847045 RepID=UPI003D2413E8